MNKILDGALSLLDLWVKARFGYAIYALKIVLGALLLIICMDRYTPETLAKEMIIPHPLLFSHFMAFCVVGSAIILIFYFTGDFIINLLGKTLHYFVSKLNRKRDE